MEYVLYNTVHAPVTNIDFHNKIIDTNDGSFMQYSYWLMFLY